MLLLVMGHCLWFLQHRGTLKTFQLPSVFSLDPFPNTDVSFCISLLCPHKFFPTILLFWWFPTHGNEKISDHQHAKLWSFVFQWPFCLQHKGHIGLLGILLIQGQHLISCKEKCIFEHPVHSLLYFHIQNLLPIFYCHIFLVGLWCYKAQ